MHYRGLTIFGVKVLTKERTNLYNDYVIEGNFLELIISSFTIALIIFGFIVDLLKTLVVVKMAV